MFVPAPGFKERWRFWYSSKGMFTVNAEFTYCSTCCSVYKALVLCYGTILLFYCLSSNSLFVIVYFFCYRFALQISYFVIFTYYYCYRIVSYWNINSNESYAACNSWKCTVVSTPLFLSGCSSLAFLRYAALTSAMLAPLRTPTTRWYLESMSTHWSSIQGSGISGIAFEWRLLSGLLFRFLSACFRCVFSPNGPLFIPAVAVGWYLALRCAGSSRW